MTTFGFLRNISRRVSLSGCSVLALGLMLGCTLASVPAFAQFEHQLLRRVAVFPIKDSTTGATAGSRAENRAGTALDEAWWQMREVLTESKRFLVASRQFLQKSDAFQPRADLLPADAILLGRLLDAHALITAELNGRRLTARAYDGGTGVVLWVKSLDLHPSLTVSDQLPMAARRLTRDFVASIPYQGFQIVDAMLGRPVLEEGDVKTAQVDVGVGARVQAGDPVQWVKVEATGTAALFQGGARLTVLAEGRVVSVEQGTATVELLRTQDMRVFKEFALVRLPREAERLVSEDAINEGIRGNVSVELISPEITPMERFRDENRPLATTLSWVGSLAAFLLLAF